MPRHGSHRIHRRAADTAAAGRRAHRPLPRPQGRPTAGRALGLGGRDRRGGPEPTGDAARRVRRRGRRLLPGALAGPARLRGGRPHGGDQLRGGGPRCRRTPDRLPGWAGAGVRRGGPVPAPAVPGRGGPDPAGQRGADGRVAGRGDHRLRLGVVRDAAIPDRAATCHDHPALGPQPDPTDRGPRRAALPGRLHRASAGRQPGLRHRRAGRADLPRHDAALRPDGRAAPTDHRAGPRAHPVALVALGRPGHPRAECHRPSPGGKPDPRGGRARARHRPLRAGPTRWADRLRRRGGAGAGQGA